MCVESSIVIEIYFVFRLLDVPGAYCVNKKCRNIIIELMVIRCYTTPSSRKGVFLTILSKLNLDKSSDLNFP